LSGSAPINHVVISAGDRVAPSDFSVGLSRQSVNSGRFGRLFFNAATSLRKNGTTTTLQRVCPAEMNEVQQTLLPMIRELDAGGPKISKIV
jgi:hypothetical protein